MNIINAIPKKTLALVVVLVAVFVILLFLLLLPSRTEAPTSNNTPKPTTSRVNITRSPQRIPEFRSGFIEKDEPNYGLVFRLPEGLTLPKTIETLEVSREITDADIVFLKKAFAIEGDPFVAGTTRYWQSSDQIRALQVDVESGYVQYGSDETTPASRKITAGEAKVVAEEFLKKFNLVTIFPNTARVLMFTGEGELSETENESVTTLYEVFHVLSHEGAPIYYQFATPATVSVFVGANGSVKGLRYFNIRPVRTTQNTIIDLDEVKERALGGDYTIVKVGGNQDTFPTEGLITITSATVIHFDDKKNSYLFPAVLLEGTIQPSGRGVSLYVSVLDN